MQVLKRRNQFLSPVSPREGVSQRDDKAGVGGGERVANSDFGLGQERSFPPS